MSLIVTVVPHCGAAELLFVLGKLEIRYRLDVEIFNLATIDGWSKVCAALALLLQSCAIVCGVYGFPRLSHTCTSHARLTGSFHAPVVPCCPIRRELAVSRYCDNQGHAALS